MPILHENRFAEKTPYLKAIDKLLNKANKKRLRDIQQQLLSTKNLGELIVVLTKGKHGIGEEELKHVATDWLDPGRGWWRDQSPDQKLRDGFSQTIDLMIEHGKKGERGRPVGVDVWWIANSGAFEVVNLLSKHQVTVLLRSPFVPG